MAETIMRAKVAEQGLSEVVKIDSAGIISYHQGESADARMRLFAFQRGYHIEGHSRPLVKEDFYNFDVIVGMDSSNVRDINKRRPDDAVAEIKLASQYLDSNEDVPDPYYGGAAGFTLVIDMLEKICDAIIKKELKNCS